MKPVSLIVKKQECQRLCFWIGIRSVVLGHTPSNQADLQNFDTCHMTSMFVSGDMAIQREKKKKKRGLAIVILQRCHLNSAGALAVTLDVQNKKLKALLMAPRACLSVSELIMAPGCP